jgi:Gnt-I system high-affinity gluconate transporter
MPSFGAAVFTGLVPVILMAFQAIVNMTMPKDSPLASFAGFVGNPAIALLIAVLIAIFTFGLNRGRKMPEVMKTVTESIAAVAMIILIIGAGGAFKQVLVDSGVDKYIASVMKGTNLSPLILAWLIAAILRIALGSATVAAMTAAGIAAPLIGTVAVSPELMVLATGAGSLIFSHVNDPGFWIFKEYFNLSIPETIRSWSVLETIISVVGLIGVLILSTFIV